MPEKALPAHPSLEQYKKQAKELLQLSKASDPEATERFKRHLPAKKRARVSFTLTQAQLVIAREHGFESWPKFTRQIELLRHQNSPSANDPVTAFIEAASVPRVGNHVSGTLDLANSILAANPGVATKSIFTAAIIGDDSSVRAFIARDRNSAVAKSGPYKWDPLTYLCFSRYLRLERNRSAGFVRAATALLDAGADPNTGWFEPDHQPKPSWESAIYGAAGLAADPDLTRLLLERGAEPNDGETPYHVPENYNNEVARVLIASGKLTPDSLTMMLLRKADIHDLDGAKILLEAGADPNRQTRWHYTALHQSVRRDNRLAIIQTLLDHGADLSVKNNVNHRSGLAMAARRGRADILREMQQRGLPVELEGVDQLIAACALNDRDLIRSLTANNPLLVHDLRAQGGTLLAEFAGIGNTEGVRNLLDLGIDVAALYQEGDPYFEIARDSTALHVAAWKAYPATVKLLLERGAPVDLGDDRGRTPLMLAVRACVDSYWIDRRTPESVEALLKAGASANKVDYPCGYAEVDALLKQFKT